MVHPFFDAPCFAWIRKEANPFYSMLTTVITDPDEIWTLYIRSGGNAAAVVRNQAATTLWTEVLDALGTALRIRALCEHLKSVPRLKGNVPFHSAVDAVINARPEMDQQMFAPNVVVLDRTPLRGYLSDFAATDRRLRVVVVKGPPGSGKSWTSHVFEAAARDCGAIYCPIFGGQVSKVADFIDELFAAMGALVPERILNATTGPASYSDVCRDLQRKAMELKRSLWIAIDDLSDFDDEIRMFCEKMGERMSTPAFASWFRLLLIDYPDDRPAPAGWDGRSYTVDKTSVESVELKDVQEFLREVPGTDGKRMLEPDVERIAREVMVGAEGVADAERLQFVHDRLVAYIGASR